MDSCSHPNQMDCTVYDTGNLFGLCLDCLKKVVTTDFDVMVSAYEILKIIRQLENKIEK